MANFSITVVNTLDFFGPSQPTKWNSFLWNAANWGQDADLGTFTTKVVDSTVTPISDDVRYIMHAVDVETLTSDTDIVLYYTITILNDLTFDADMYSEVLTDGAGYTRMFPSNATNAEDRDIPTWVDNSPASSSWSSSTPNSTTWSAA